MQDHNKLRPTNFDEFIGQKRLVNTLKVIISSASKRNVMVDHILLHGIPGVGKTTLAYLIANEMGANLRFAQGPLLEKKADILSLFGSISKNDVILIDEIHGINKNVEELIYSALEDGVVDVIIGVEGESKIIRMKLPPFTLIGASTKISSMSEPLKERFGIIGKLVPYLDEEIEIIIKNTAKKLGITINETEIRKIASHSKSIPRVANTLLKRVNDFRVAQNSLKVTSKIVETTFDSLGFYKHGLNDHHIEYLKVLTEIFYNSWASIDAIRGVMTETKENIENEIEPILLKHSLIAKSSRGRKISDAGIKYLDVYNLKSL